MFSHEEMGPRRRIDTSRQVMPGGVAVTTTTMSTEKMKDYRLDSSFNGLSFRASQYSDYSEQELEQEGQCKVLKLCNLQPPQKRKSYTLIPYQSLMRVPVFSFFNLSEYGFENYTDAQRQLSNSWSTIPTKAFSFVLSVCHSIEILPAPASNSDYGKYSSIRLKVICLV